MTAHAGRGWVLAPCLVAMEAEANRIAPHRSTASDGSSGDAAHAASVSDHNPAGGYVCALDLTHDPRGGFDSFAAATAIAARHDPRVKYLISNRLIWTPDGRGWHAYTGADPHESHVHVSVFNTPAARDDLRPWWPSGPVPTPTTPAQPAQPTEDHDMGFVIIDGIGIFARIGDVLAGYPDLPSYARDKDRSPGAPVLTVSGATASHMWPDLLKAMAKATGA